MLRKSSEKSGKKTGEIKNTDSTRLVLCFDFPRAVWTALNGEREPNDESEIVYYINEEW